MNSLNQIDRYLSPQIRSKIEQRYLAEINRRATLDQVIGDPNFYQNTESFPQFYSDHGVVHHRDVALQILEVLELTHGLLIPNRNAERLEFMKGYGVILALLHDPGMADFSNYGRSIHPEAASQLIFSPGFDDLFETIWDENCAYLADRLLELDKQGFLGQKPQQILREMLAMVNCHSKSKLPVAILDDLTLLRVVMQTQLSTPLPEIYATQQVQKAKRALAVAQEWQDLEEIESCAIQLNRANKELQRVKTENRESTPSSNLKRYYVDFVEESYLWLLSPIPAVQELVLDVVDTLRTLRCADSFRQRGTTLKTSGGYEIFVNHRSANAVIALRLGEDELYLLELEDSIRAGESNIYSSQITQDGDLRISFHRGSFQDQNTNRQAAYYAAIVINDIQGDGIDSFVRSSQGPQGSKNAADMKILLEGVDDNLDFTRLVHEQLGKINPQAAERVRSVPSLQKASELELRRYLQAGELIWERAKRQEILERIGRTGHQTQKIDPEAGFEGVALIYLKAGENLVEAGAPSNFVYVPLSEGLRIIPLGGYAAFPVNPWMPLGITGVIRGADRNATITAEAEVWLLMIPKSVYLSHWDYAYSLNELTDLFRQRTTSSSASAPT